jgi:hypothetical protein
MTSMTVINCHHPDTRACGEEAWGEGAVEVDAGDLACIIDELELERVSDDSIGAGLCPCSVTSSSRDSITHCRTKSPAPFEAGLRKRATLLPEVGLYGAGKGSAATR